MVCLLWPPSAVFVCQLTAWRGALLVVLRVQIAGTPDQTLTALKMMTDKLRAVTPPDVDRGMHHEYGGRDSPADKRIRGDGPPSGTCL